MSCIRQLAGSALVLVGLISAEVSGAAPSEAAGASGSFVGWSTNGPGVYRLRFLGTQGVPGMPVSLCPPPLDLPPEVRFAMLTFRAAASSIVVTNTEPVFDHFVVDSLNNTIWTN